MLPHIAGHKTDAESLFPTVWGATAIKLLSLGVGGGGGRGGGVGVGGRGGCVHYRLCTQSPPQVTAARAVYRWISLQRPRASTELF